MKLLTFKMKEFFVKDKQILSLVIFLKINFNRY